MSPKFKKRLIKFFVFGAIIVGLGVYYVKSHPLVFNESFWQHAHCIKGAGMMLSMYADQHGGQFPYHKNGYGDALLLLKDDWDEALTGPGYDTEVFILARKSGEDAPESEFGRVYVQGLNTKSDREIALLFDKLPTPGGDHCHFFSRFFAPLAREVWLVGNEMQKIPETDWPAFSKQQIELLVAAGIARETAAMYYAERPKE